MTLFSDEGVMSISGGEIPPFKLALRNSFVVCFAVNALCLVVGGVAAYAFSRMRFWFKKQFLLTIIAVRMLPEISLVVPLYMIVRRFHLLDTPYVLIIVYASYPSCPSRSWMLKSYFESIPVELEEAARHRRLQPDGRPGADHPAPRRPGHHHHRHLHPADRLGRVPLRP